MAQLNLKVWVDSDGNFKVIDQDSEELFTDNLDADLAITTYNVSLNFPDTQPIVVEADITAKETLVEVKLTNV